MAQGRFTDNLSRSLLCNNLIEYTCELHRDDFCIGKILNAQNERKATDTLCSQHPNLYLRLRQAFQEASEMHSPSHRAADSRKAARRATATFGVMFLLK